MKRAPLILIGVIVLVTLFLVLCTFVQRPYEAVIVDRAGKIVDPGTLYRGWKICLPTDRVTRIDTRDHLYTSTVKEAFTADKQTLTVRSYVAWKIIDPKTFYLKLKTDLEAESRIARVVDSRINTLMGEYESNEFFNVNMKMILTEKIEAQVVERVNQELLEFGLQVHQVGFSRISFPPMVAESVNQNTAKERQTAAGIIRNEGITRAEVIKGQAQVDSQGMVDKAKREAAIIKGQADRDAISILGAVTDNPYAQEWFQIYKASELAKNSFARGNNIIMLAPDSMIVKIFFSNEGAPRRPEGTPKPPLTRPIPNLTQPATSTAPAITIETVDPSKLLPKTEIKSILPNEPK